MTKHGRLYGRLLEAVNKLLLTHNVKEVFCWRIAGMSAQWGGQAVRKGWIHQD